ncbi:hypothetical protein GQ457_04G015620 [Hibiscus cannabinus]
MVTQFLMLVVAGITFSLHFARNYPDCKVTGICNSTIQKTFIEEQCRDGQLQNVEIIVAYISTFEMETSLDMIHSIKMFEHLLTTLRYACKLIVRETPYCFQKYTPMIYNIDLIKLFTNLQYIEEWLKRMNKNLDAIKPIMKPSLSPKLFGNNNGEKWMVALFLFKKK